MDAVEYKATRVNVTPDVSIVYGDDWLSIQDFAADEDGNATVTKTELPALLDRLQEAAEAMQIPTKQGELVKACKALLEYRRLNTLNFQLEKLDDFLRQIEAAMPGEAK